MTCYGLFYILNQQPVPLPLHEVRAKASLSDLAASVHLSQIFTNESANTIECTYSFPVPARAAVYSFQLVKADGTKVVGVVQEKEEARETYDQALSEGRLASLMEQDTPDTFTVSVGNVLPREKVTVELTYATELTEDKTNDSIRFHLPAHIGARYGQPPNIKPAPHTSSVSPSTNSSFFHLDLAIESVQPIRQIGSPSHTISTTLGPDPSLPNAKELPFSNFAQVTFSSETTLTKDFILTLQSGSLDAPRCIAERHASAEHDTAAVSLSFVPKFKLPEIESGEYLCLVDRSGSMNGERIAMARKALVVLLRSLPKSGTRFNLISFGSSHSSLWSESREYSQLTLQHATGHVDTMEADYGGTEMKAALEAAFSKRAKDRPTNLFVLTDGDAWDLDGVYSAVQSAVSAAPPTAPIRIFVLGIGNSASTAMCEGIARLGNGAAQFVVDGESLTGKMARLLKASRSPQLLNIRLELSESKETPKDVKEKVDDGFELLDDESEAGEKNEQATPAASLASLSLFDDSEDPLAATQDADKPFAPPKPVDLPPPPPIQQAPHKIQTLFPGTRHHSYLILSPATLLPSSIFLRAELASGQKLELELPVTVLSLYTDSPIHVLAARKLIQDLEDGRHGLKEEGGSEQQLARVVKASIVRLGKAYSLVSKHTSFVAVDESEVDVKRKQKTPKPAPLPAPGATPFFAPARGFGAAPQPRMRVMAASAPGGGSGGGGGGGLFGMFGSSKKSAPPFAPAPGGSSWGGAMARGGAPRGGAPQMAMCSMAPPSAAPFGAIPPPPPAPAAAPLTFASQSYDTASFGGPPPSFGAPSGSLGAAPPSSCFGSSAPPTAADNADLSTSDRIDRLARLQDFDGSFSPSAVPLCTLSSTGPSLSAIVTHLARIRIAPLARFSALDESTRDKVLSTAVVVAFWKKSMSKQREEWEGMADKGLEFGAEQIGTDEFEQLIARVSGFV